MIYCSSTRVWSKSDDFFRHYSSLRIISIQKKINEYFEVLKHTRIVDGGKVIHIKYVKATLETLNLKTSKSMNNKIILKSFHRHCVTLIPKSFSDEWNGQRFFYGVVSLCVLYVYYQIFIHGAYNRYTDHWSQISHHSELTKQTTKAHS